jgi:trimeric autotransporter adhesin
MKKNLLFILLISLTCQLRAADYYWVGGAGNWSDLNHWRLGSSAGSIPSIVPAASDNVFFTSASGFGATPATATVTLDANGFCNNMSWSGVPNTPTFTRANGTLILKVLGDVVLSGNTTYSLVIDLEGGTANTLASHGRVLGSVTFNINKPGGGITVTDSLVSTAAAVVNITSGAFNIAGKKMSVFIFGCGGSNPRSVDFTNSDITVGYQYVVTGANKTVSASGSTVAAMGYLLTDNIAYNKVINNAMDAGNFSVYNCTFSTITFLNPNLGSGARIHDGNTADTVRFMGSGYIGSNNNVNVILAAGGIATANGNTLDTVICGGGVSIGANNVINRIVAGPVSGGAATVGGGNNVTYWQHSGHFSVSAGPNTVDTILLTAGKTISFRGAFNVNKYLELNGTSCDAFSEVSGDPVAGSLNFAPGANAVMNNMILTGLKATGNITPLAVTGIDNGGNTGFTITPPITAGSTLYWVNGAGDWNDRSHWSNTSGGTDGACVPYIGDDVIFDGNSGLTTGTITTSSSAFCNNMTWTNVGTVTFAESGAYKFSLYGSLSMDPSVTMNALMEMEGNANAGITINGTTTGGLQFGINKTNNAVVTLNDNWSNLTGGSVVHRSGGLNLAGRTISLAYYSSNISGIRAVDITNATLNFNTSWDYRGSGKSILSTGSHITAPAIITDGLSYPWVDATSTGSTSITATSFGQFTFTDPSATSNVLAGGSNTFRKLEFKGRGLVAAGNNIDTLLLAGSRNYIFAGTNTINKYLKAQSAACAGLSEIKGSPVGTLAFVSGAVADISNVYMQNMTATGPITPIAFSGADAGGNSGWTINVASGGKRYWVNGAGDWSDPAHWSSSSGGTGGTACVPTVYDDVYFDAGSGFTAVSKTVTINNGNAYAHNINWTGAINNPTWSKSGSWNLECWGDSVILNPNATFTVSFLILKGSNATFMKGSAPLGDFDLYIDKPGGSLTILDDYSNTATDFQLINGALNAPGRTLNVRAIDNLGSANASSIDISNANITAITGWRYNGTIAPHALNAAGSTITTSGFTANGLIYNKVNITGTSAVSGSISNATVDSLVFTDPSTISTAGISGTGNTLNYVEYKGSGGIYGTNNTIDTLVFFPGNRYVLNSGTNTTITGEWYGSGTPCRLTEIVSSSTTNATVTKASGDVTFDYVRLQRIARTGGASFSTQQHSIDLGGNTGWTMAPYDGAAPMEGLGPDIAVHASLFPYTLNTDGFFGSPLSQYLWNDNSTRDTLAITGPGTYSVAVSFPDGCSISDEIVVSEAMTLPVTLISFKAGSKNCQSVLEWKVADAVNFSHFIIEQSKDGRQFTGIADISYTAGIDQYSYTDDIAGTGTTFYRLKCVDADGKYKFSSVASVNLDCNTEMVHVYPTVTSNTVKVILPQGSEKAQLYIISTSGQRMNPVVQSSGLVRTINLEGFPPAVYLLQVVNGRETKSFKIVKQ